MFMVVFLFFVQIGDRAVCYGDLERFKECCNVEGGHLEHLRDLTVLQNVSKVLNKCT